MRMGRNSEDFLGENTKEQGRIKKKEKEEWEDALGEIVLERKEKGELFWIVGGFFFEKKHAATRRE